MLRAIALALVVGMLLAFPLAYVVDAELRNQRIAGGLFVIELTIAVVVYAFVHSRVRRS